MKKLYRKKRRSLSFALENTLWQQGQAKVEGWPYKGEKMFG